MTAPTTASVDRLEARLEKLVAHHERAKSLQDFRRYADDPLGFITEVLKERPWAKQEEIAHKVAAHPRVAVQGCNAAGKDWLAGRLALWWALARGGLAVLTGPTERQVRQILMGQVRAAFTRAEDLPGELFEMSLRFGPAEDRGILAFTSVPGDASRLTGYHAPGLLVIITEAQGVDPATYEAAFACAASEGARILVLGNPLQPTGPFYDICTSPTWARVKISARDHPNVIEDRNVIPGGISRAGVAQFAQEYGEDSGIYRARVLGEFSTTLAEGLIDRAWLEAAAERFRSNAFTSDSIDQAWQAGLDVARFGRDRTVLGVRRGPILLGMATWVKCDLMTTADRVPHVLKGEPFRLEFLGSRADGWVPVWHYCPPHPREVFIRLLVDEVGIGAGVVDELRRRRYPVAGFNGGASPPGGPDSRFANRRASSYWELRQLLELRLVAVPWREGLVEELVNTEYLELPSGKLAIGPKNDLETRIGRSPDEADSLAMTFEGFYQRPEREWSSFPWRV